jgi:hypothetical protein
MVDLLDELRHVVLLLHLQSNMDELTIQLLETYRQFTRKLINVIVRDDQLDVEDFLLFLIDPLALHIQALLDLEELLLCAALINKGRYQYP